MYNLPPPCPWCGGLMIHNTVAVSHSSIINLYLYKLTLYMRMLVVEIKINLLKLLCTTVFQTNDKSA